MTNGPNAPVLRVKSDTIQIIDAISNKNIRGLVPVAIGQKISLKGLLTSNKKDQLKWQWDLGNDIVADYVTNNKELRPVDVSREAMVRDHIEFYWILPGKKTVSLSAKVGSKEFKRQASFEVHSPNVISFSAKSQVEVKVDDDYYEKGQKVAGTWIHFGGYPDRNKLVSGDPIPGIEYEAKLKGERNIPVGRVYFVQLQDGKLDSFAFPTIPVMVTPSTPEKGYSLGDYLLPVDEIKVFRGNDSPGNHLPTDKSELRFEFSSSFVTYVMFGLYGDDNIFVPLAKLEWAVKAIASRLNAESKWELEGNYEFPAPRVTIIKKRDLPTWSNESSK